jgi:DNA-binding response OmpR family regulator
MRVLVADDNRDEVLSLDLLLSCEGHQVRGVYQGDEVLPAMRSFKPDAVLLDIKMPGLSGFEVARLIRSRYGDESPLLVAISGHFKQGGDKVLSEIVGFDYHLAKPCDPGELLALLSV